MKKRACDACRKLYEPKRSTSKYCSSLCRTRASRAGTSTPRTATVIDVTGMGEAFAGALLGGDRPDEGAVTRATRKALEDADRLETVAGASALALARRVDSPMTDTGSAMATVVRELRAVMAEATKGTAAKTSPQGLRDELADRRAAQGA